MGILAGLNEAACQHALQHSHSSQLPASMSSAFLNSHGSVCASLLLCGAQAALRLKRRLCNL